MATQFTIGFHRPDGSYYVPMDDDCMPVYMLSHAEAAAVLWCGYADEASRGVARVIEAAPYVPEGLAGAFDDASLGDLASYL
jgi:hypothetical protein